MGPAEWPLVGRDRELRDLGRLTGHRAVVVAGPVGVGKSRLVAHVGGRLARGGVRVVGLRVTRSTATVQFGPFAPWIPDDIGVELSDRLHVLRALRRSLCAGERPVVVVVDDAHLLDEGSAALVFHLATQGHASVLATVRSGEPCADAVEALWKDRLAELIELSPLSQTDTLLLARHALGGRMAGSATQKLWSLSGGVPLYLREVLRAAVDQGVLTTSGGLWRWDGELDGSAHLARLTDDNLGRTTAEEREVLELVAVGEPVPLPIVQQMGLLDVLEQVQRKRLVSTDADDHGLTVRMAHPLYGELLRAGLPTLAARSRMASLAAAALRIGWQDRDALVVARWCVESGTTPATAQVYLVAAYRSLSLTDWVAAERFGRAAEQCGGGAQASLLRAAARVQLGGWGEADTVLAGVDPATLDDDLLAEYTRFRAGHLTWSQGQTVEGRQLLDDAARRLHGPARARVLVEAAYTAAFACEPTESLELATRAIGEPASAAALVEAHAVAALAWTIAGQTARALRAAEAVAPHTTTALSGDVYPGNAAVVALPARCMSLAVRGRLAEAATVAEAALEHGRHDGPADDLHLRRIALGVRGRIALFQGRPAIAERCGLDALVGAGTGSSTQWLAAIAITGAAQRGEIETAKRLTTRPGADVSTIPLFLHELTVARGWLAAAQGDLARGRSLLAQAAASAARNGAWLLELLALLDLTRLGAADLATTRLDALRRRVDGDLAVMAADHARAAAEGDGHALDDVAARFETMGMLLVAAEAAAAATTAHGAAGRRAEQRAARARATRLAASCDGARTPALVLGDVDPLVATLTAREREVMELAARGSTNRAIAGRLFISIRTVNTHLNHVYGKLGVHDRDDLGAFVPRHDGDANVRNGGCGTAVTVTATASGEDQDDGRSVRGAGGDRDRGGPRHRA